MAPQTTPVRIAMTTASGRLPVCCQQKPSEQLDSAAVDETDRSISPAMISNVIENAISMISPMLWIRNVMLPGGQELLVLEAADDQRRDGEHRDELVPLEVRDEASSSAPAVGMLAAEGDEPVGTDRDAAAARR